MSRKRQAKTRWTLRGGIVLTGGRSANVEVVLVCPAGLTAKESRELRSARLALHDLTPVEEIKVGPRKPSSGEEGPATTIDRLRAVVDADPEEVNDDGLCTLCDQPMEIRSGEEPTAVCDHCAQAIVQDDLPKLLAAVEAVGLRGDHCYRTKEHDVRRCVGCAINAALRALTDGSKGAEGTGLDGPQRHRV